MIHVQRLMLGVALLVGGLLLNPAVQAATLTVKIMDAESGEPLAGRVNLTGEDKKVRHPNISLEILGIGAKMGKTFKTRKPYIDFAYADGECIYRNVKGKFKLIVMRGFEYKPFEVELELGADDQTVEAKLERIIDMKKLNFYSGDMHTHLMLPNDETAMKAQMAMQKADDLNIVNGLSIHYIEKQENERASERMGEDAVFQVGDYAALGGEEFRHAEIGHQALLLIKDFILCKDDGYIPLGSDAAYMTFKQGGFAGICHGGNAGKGYRLMYLLDAMGVNQFHEILQFRKLAKEQWYGQLSSNIRSAPVGSTDMPVGMGIPGGDRTYVFIDGELTMRSWLDGLAAGRCFVSSGPLLDYTLNGKRVWEDIHLSAGGGKVTLKGWVAGRYPVQEISIVQNGEKIHTIEGGEKNKVDVEFEINVEKSSWIALCVEGKQPDGHPFNAHSNASFVYVDHKPLVIDQGWRGPSYAKSNIRKIRKFIETEAKVADLESAKTYYAPIWDATDKFYDLQYKSSKGKDVAPTLFSLYPTEKHSTFKKDQPVPIAFSVAGHVVSPGSGGVSVQVGKGKATVYQGFSPYYIPDLKPGEHTVTLTLVDHEGKLLKNEEAKVVKTITVK